jgi:hypothetical protein
VSDKESIELGSDEARNEMIRRLRDLAERAEDGEACVTVAELPSGSVRLCTRRPAPSRETFFLEIILRPAGGSARSIADLEDRMRLAKVLERLDFKVEESEGYLEGEKEVTESDVVTELSRLIEAIGGPLYRAAQKARTPTEGGAGRRRKQ